jgi:hypothetical protein
MAECMKRAAASLSGPSALSCYLEDIRKPGRYLRRKALQPANNMPRIFTVQYPKSSWQALLCPLYHSWLRSGRERRTTAVPRADLRQVCLPWCLIERRTIKTGRLIPEAGITRYLQNCGLR